MSESGGKVDNETEQGQGSITDVDRAVAHFKLEGMRDGFRACDRILESRIIAWAKAAQEAPGRMFVPREAKARAEKRKLCLVRADELTRVRELLAQVMGAAGMDAPGSDQTITSPDAGVTPQDGG